jgi:hypothetical protein
VKDVRRASQLPERLVRDLVRRKIPLGSVDDILTFIRSKVGDYGAARVASYERIFAFAKSAGSIVL